MKMPAKSENYRRMLREAFQISKSLFADTLRATGLLSLLTNRRLANRVSVITYHRVINTVNSARIDSTPGIVVSESEFAMQMKTLRESYNPISLDELLAHIERGIRLRDRSCLVTFDDGWIDNYDVAFPILKEFRIPAVIFLPCDFVSTDRMFWQEEMVMRLRRMLESGDGQALEAARNILRCEDDSPIPTVEDIRLFITSLKQEPNQNIARELNKVRQVFKRVSSVHHYNAHLSWSQIREMNEAGITFASHALSHTFLDRLDTADCQRELAESKRRIEEELNTEVFAIAYPNGNCNDDVCGLSREAGYQLGFTTQHRLFQRGSDSLRIPRINIHSDNSYSSSRFMCTIAGLF